MERFFFAVLVCVCLATVVDGERASEEQLRAWFNQLINNETARGICGDANITPVLSAYCHHYDWVICSSSHFTSVTDRSRMPERMLREGTNFFVLQSYYDYYCCQNRKLHGVGCDKEMIGWLCCSSVATNVVLPEIES